MLLLGYVYKVALVVDKLEIGRGNYIAHTPFFAFPCQPTYKQWGKNEALAVRKRILVPNPNFGVARSDCRTHEIACCST